MSKKLYEKIQKYLEKDQNCNLVTVMQPGETGEFPTVTKKYVIQEGASDFSYVPVYKKEEERIISYEPIGKGERLIILGGGHISKELCEFSAKIGFVSWVIDEREEFANEERFPSARRVICDNFLKALDEVKINKNDYVTIITRGHSCDGECLLHVLNHELPRYLGMIGSKHRVRAQFKMFKEMGVPDEKLAFVHNPIGLDIHAVTPEEIAISILAELIMEKRTNKNAHIIQTDLDGYMIDAIAQYDKPAALATIARSAGSTPRKEGAKMLVCEDGSIIGSIGGGLGENVVIQRACAIIGTGKSELFPFKLNADVAAKSGMACGGDMEVLIEDLYIDFSEE